MNPSKRTVVHWTPDADAIISFVANEPGGDRAVLERVAEAVVSGQSLHPDLQELANALIAQALLKGKLPPKASGRPEADPFHGHGVAFRYFELLDAGQQRHEVLDEVSRNFGIEPRHVERLVQQHRAAVGWDVDERAAHRAFKRSCEETGFQDYEEDVRMRLRQAAGLSALPPATGEAKLQSINALLAKRRADLADVFKPE
ncbi:hypothetical protein ACFPPF_21925 [Xenophilus aerolatus]|nr:hypothetical protein [Xenophilus aerolatus]